MNRRVHAVVLFALGILAAGAAHTATLLPAGSVVALAGGRLDLACTDLDVAGTLSLGNGAVVNARNVIVRPGGVLNGGSGVLEVGGDFVGGVGFQAAASTVRFTDACGGSSASIAGSNTFHDATFVSTTGKTWRFSAGTLQTFLHALTITGTPSQPLQVRSDAPYASFNLVAGAAQSIANVGATNMWAEGQWLAPYQVNQGGSNARRWFGDPAQETLPIPAIGGAGLALLAGLMFLSAVWARRRKSFTQRRQR
jgi:hypothetical protein